MGAWTRKDVLATIVMIVAQLNLALVTISYKFATQIGASLRVVVAYRMTMAAVLLLLTTFVYERLWKKKVSDGQNYVLTWKILALGFFCGLLGGAVSYNLYVLSLDLVSTTSATAISNMFPAITFIMAVICRREKLEIHNRAGRAKILGTIVTVAGAMVLSFYKGRIYDIWPDQWKMPERVPFEPIGQSTHRAEVHKHSEILGILLAMASCVSSSASIIIEDKLLEMYPSQLRGTTIIIGMGAIQCLCFAAIMDRDTNYWILDFTVLTTMIVYMAIVASGVMMVLTGWCIQKKGSFFVSIFSPITLIAVAILSPLVLSEPLHQGSVIGALIIIGGVYMVIWGKREKQPESKDTNHPIGSEPHPVQQETEDLENIA